MPESSALPLKVVEALGRGWTVVTANQRAARTLRRAFEQQQRAKGLRSWAPPEILAWESWAHSTYRQMVVEGSAADLLLNQAQEHTLWRAVVMDDASTGSLRPVDALAETAAAAWKLLHAYRGRATLKSYAGNSDTKVFTGWVTAFERRLKRGQYISDAQLVERLRTAVLAREVAAPSGLLLVGFDTTTAAQDALVEAFKATGTVAEWLPQTAMGAVGQLAPAASELEELRACAAWVRNRVERNPKTRVAVIVPATEPVRTEIDREFRRVLCPELNEIGATAAEPYEFSLGVALSQTPMVADAMNILRWSQGALGLERISSLLLSRYFAAGDDDERLARAEFDAFELRRQKLLQPRLTVEALHRIASRWKYAGTIPLLLKHLAALRDAFGAPELPLLQRHGEWVQIISDMLSAAGWAPTAQLDSTEFQMRRKWESALDELATLDFEDQPVPFAQALASLEHIVQQTLFAPESHHAPVQVMGPLESAGSTFDAVWFLRANDVDWSAASSPNPLLPWAMQRDLGMPGTVPARDAEVARAITRRIVASAGEIVFSYARESADGPQRPSPALDGLELERIEASSLASATAELEAVELEAVADEPAIPAPPATVLHGGASVLEKQAACAFRAFAEARLFSAALDTAVLGLNAGERGSIVHRVLQLFWDDVKSHANLRALGTAELDATLDRCIGEALTGATRAVEAGWNAAYIEAERQRLRNLLRPWLDYEAQERSPFVVKALEHEHRDVAIGPLHLTVKVDRVDTWLNVGEPAGDIILDYKTGIAKPSAWEGERPDAPQLPLYAVVAGSPELAGVAFASVRSGNGREIRGFAAQQGVLPRGSTRDLESQVQEWRTTLTSLAEEFHAGRVEVRPKQYPETCKYCQQRLLCRLDISALSADEIQEDEGAEEENG